MSKAELLSEIADPHDTFFRQMLSDTSTAIDFVQNYLPAEVVALLDLTQLRIEKESFIDARLRKHYSDVLYSVPLKAPLTNAEEQANEVEQLVGKRTKRTVAKVQTSEARICVYLLFEHKSKPERAARLQLLRYIARIWEKEWRRRKRLSAILPILFYHGQERWLHSVEFSELVLDFCSGLIKGRRKS